MIRRLAHAFNYVFRRRRFEHELDQEHRAAFDLVVDRLTARGMSPEEARRAARLEFEGFDTIKESVREGQAGASLPTVWQDLRYALRALARRPSFAAVALLTLALGIGVNTAVFSVFYAVLLRPLPYRQPGQLVLVWAAFRSAGTNRAPVSGAILGEIRSRNRVFSDVAGIWTLTRTFTGDPPELVKHARVTTNFFDLLGVGARRGRTFTASDGGTPAILLTDGIFRRRFAASEGLLGKAVAMERATTLVGVLPAGFELHFAPDANIPADVQSFDTFRNSIWGERGEYYIRVVARLKPGVSMADAGRDMDRVAGEIRAAYTPYGSDDLRLSAASMHADSVREANGALTALFAGALFILAICCVNVTSLLLARTSDRRKEMALRIAVGASRARILRQLLAEGAVLCAFGTALGLAAGWAGFRILLAFRPERFVRIGEAGLSWPVFTFAAAAATVAALLFGLAPAIECFQLAPLETLRSAGRGLLGRFHRRAGGALIIGEVALGFVLVTGAALASRTLARIERAPVGFEPRQRLTFQIPPPASNAEGLRDWERDLAALPGVEAVGAISHLPFDTDIPNWYGPYRPQGAAAQSSGWISDLRCVTPGYFATAGARLVEGRYFNDQDGAGSRMVAIVDDVLARATWPGQSAVGQTLDAAHLTAQGFEDLSTVVVGVVEHLQSHSLTNVVRGQLYFPFGQSPRSPLTWVVRTSVPPLSLAPPIREMLHRRAPRIAMAKVRPMTEYVAREVAPAGFTAVLAAVFGGLALLLAGIGIYGVLQYQVSRRFPEMGIRMALGACGGDVLRLVLGEGIALTAAGVAAGAAASLVAGRWLGSLVYGVSPRDPLSYACALLLLPAAALAGCWRPARKAAAANPAEAIRQE